MAAAESNVLYCLNPVVAIEDFGDHSLALHCEDLHFVELNATARDLVRLLDGATPLEAAAAHMAAMYHAPYDMVVADAHEIALQMVKLDVIKIVEPGTIMLDAPKTEEADES